MNSNDSYVFFNVVFKKSIEGDIITLNFIKLEFKVRTATFDIFWNKKNCSIG